MNTDSKFGLNFIVSRQNYFFRVPELAPEMYGLDNETVVKTDNKEVKVFDLVEHLKRLYCGPITAEFMHLIVRYINTF